MEFDPNGTGESLISVPQLNTAYRTRQLVVAARVVFMFSHGALVLTASLALAWQTNASWWALFTPVWLGNALCAVCLVSSWFASFPYVRLCLRENMCRVGDTNPSMLTDILPDVLFGILGFFFLLIALIAEVLLCQYLDAGQHGKPRTVLPAVAFILLSLLACCRGICIRTSGAMFGLLGGGVFATAIAALFLPGGPLGASSWALACPGIVSCAGALLVQMRRLRRFQSVLGREERLLRRAEQLVLLTVLAALFALVAVLALHPLAPGRHLEHPGPVAVAGAAVGTGLCFVAALRARMAVLESCKVSIQERLLSWGLPNAGDGVQADGREIHEAL